MKSNESGKLRKRDTNISCVRVASGSTHDRTNERTEQIDKTFKKKTYKLRSTDSKKSTIRPHKGIKLGGLSLVSIATNAATATTET